MAINIITILPKTKAEENMKNYDKSDLVGVSGRS